MAPTRPAIPATTAPAAFVGIAAALVPLAEAAADERDADKLDAVA